DDPGKTTHMAHTFPLFPVLAAPDTLLTRQQPMKARRDIPVSRGSRGPRTPQLLDRASPVGAFLLLPTFEESNRICTTPPEDCEPPRDRRGDALHPLPRLTRS